MGKPSIFNNPYYTQFKTDTGKLSAAGYGAAGLQVAGAGIQGGLEFASAIAERQPGFSTNTPAQTSWGGVPDYNLGSTIGEASRYNPNQAGAGLIGQGAGIGAKTGAGIGSIFGPGGAAVGAGIGVGVGAIAGAIGKNALKKKATRMQNTRLTNIGLAQAQFNKANQSSQQDYLARQQYESQFL